MSVPFYIHNSYDAMWKHHTKPILPKPTTMPIVKSNLSPDVTKIIIQYTRSTNLKAFFLAHSIDPTIEFAYRTGDHLYLCDIMSLLRDHPSIIMTDLCLSSVTVKQLHELFNNTTLSYAKIKHINISFDIHNDRSDLTIFQSFINLRSLQLCFSDSSTLSPLSACPNLTSLRITNNYKLTNVTILQQLTKLKSIYFYGCCSLSNFPPFNSNLCSFHHNGKIRDLSVFSKCHKLRSFCAPYSNIQNLSLNCSLLSTLRLPNCVILQNIDNLSDCAKLTQLCIDNCKNVTNIHSLSSCRKLNKLSLNHCNSLSDLYSLSFCINLTKLHMMACKQITDITPLSNCTNLVIFDARSSGISDITALSKCIHLRSLNLSSTFVSSVNALSHCVILKELDLRYTKVVHIDALENCVNLEELDLSHTFVCNISALSKCIKLQKLDLSYTHVHDICGLGECIELQQLSLFDTYVSNANSLNKCVALTQVDLRNCPFVFCISKLRRRLTLNIDTKFKYKSKPLKEEVTE